MTHYTELQPNQLRQYIDAESIFLGLQKAKDDAQEVKGTMYWRVQDKTEYLIRQSSQGAQKSLGPRSLETETMYAKFTTRKDSVETRLRAMKSAAADQQRMNKALRVGRTPVIVVNTLNALAEAGLGQHFLTIGTHSLYAYESACGVRFMPDALATQDIDLLFDTRKRMAFASQLRTLDTSFIGALRKADPTFRVKSDQLQTAVNDDGFEIDVIRRMAMDGDPHPLRMSDAEDDLWAVQISTGNKILGAKRFSQMVASPTGHMAIMHTMDPATFVSIKREIAKKADRDPKKRIKDAWQAELIDSLIDSHMPQYRRQAPTDSDETIQHHKG